MVEGELEHLFEDVPHEVGGQRAFIGEQELVKHRSFALRAEHVRPGPLLHVLHLLDQTQALVEQPKELLVDAVDLAAKAT